MHMEKSYDCHAGFSNWMQGWSDSKKVRKKKTKKNNWEFAFRGKETFFFLGGMAWIGDWLGVEVEVELRYKH